MYMGLFILLAYSAIYFVGYYSGRIVNLRAGRDLLKNLRWAGLGLVVFTAIIATILIELYTDGIDPFVKGQLYGRFAIGPAMIVIFFVGARMQLERRKLARSKRA
jgi:hypothetical protein